MAQQPLKKVNESNGDEASKKVESIKNRAAAAAEDFDFDGLKAQLEQLKGDLATLTDAVVSVGEAKAEVAAKATRKTARKASAQARNGLDYAADQMELVLDESEQFARRRPGLVLGMAAGVGAMLALTLSRR